MQFNYNFSQSFTDIVLIYILLALLRVFLMFDYGSLEPLFDWIPVTKSKDDTEKPVSKNNKMENNYASLS